MVKISIGVTVPKRLFSDAQFVSEIDEIMKKKTAPDLKRMFRMTTDGWKEKPSFRQKITQGASSISTEVWTDNDKYALVNAGSPKHVITPRRAMFLRFRPGYRSATKPGSLQSRSASRFGRFYTTLRVNHPGFEAREFDKTIAEQYDPIFREDVQQAIEKATKRIG